MFYLADDLLPILKRHKKVNAKWIAHYEIRLEHVPFLPHYPTRNLRSFHSLSLGVRAKVRVVLDRRTLASAFILECLESIEILGSAFPG